MSEHELETLKLKNDVFLRMEEELHRLQKVNAALLDAAKEARNVLTAPVHIGVLKNLEKVIAQAEARP